MVDRSPAIYDAARCGAEAAALLEVLRGCTDLEAARRATMQYAGDCQYRLCSEPEGGATGQVLSIVRDCARVVRSLVTARSDALAGFSVVQALWDLARGVPRSDLRPGFYAEIIHLVMGLEGRPVGPSPMDSVFLQELTGRPAALARSAELDRLWSRIEAAMERYPDGLGEEARQRRGQRRGQVLAALNGRPPDWDDWSWHVRHVITDPETLSRAVRLTPAEREAVAEACRARLPFGVTPYYAALMDDDPQTGRDRAVRAQVLPPEGYVTEMSAHREDRLEACDFMQERDTSPVDLVTRRYPAVLILKPFNTCPQICVYCQRNWEIDQAMAEGALAPWEQIERACAWIESHPAICEVLVTGGDPLALPDAELERILVRISRIPHVDLIRIGSRVPVTLPMRVTPQLAELLGGLRQPGVREVCLVTHVEHPYEVTPELVGAVDRLRRQGVAVYNQLVYTFFVSRRFEAARLRLLLRRCGIDPYYTFAPKGKDETRAYRVPLARILQEQKEEARLLPGSRRTDEPVYNLPGLGKNYLRAVQHRDLISILADGSRVYEFHPWEKNVVHRSRYVGPEMPVLEYLERLAEAGEQTEDYASIWYYH